MSTLNVDKVDPSTGTALEIGTSGDTITVPSGATLAVAGTTEITGTNNVQRYVAQPIAYNGDMQVSQRTTSETGITDNRYSACDRYKIEIDSCGTWTVAQETLTSGNAYDDGFRKALRLDCTTADASPAAADAVIVSHRFEGQDLNAFKKGTSNAKAYTLAFWIKSNKTGTAQVNFNDQENTRMCSGTYTISVADTWEKKIINIAADTSGASNNDNTEFIRISWWFDAGSNYTGGTVPTAWEATSASDKGVETLSLADSTSNDVAITGVQLEVGTYTSSTLPPFQHESYGDNLQRCQRYCYNTNQNNTLYASLSVGAATATTGVYGELYFPVTMRDNPTGTVVQSTDYWALNAATGTDTFDNILVQNCSTTQGTIYCTGNVSQTSGQASRIRNNNTAARLLLTAEL